MKVSPTPRAGRHHTVSVAGFQRQAARAGTVALDPLLTAAGGDLERTFVARRLAGADAAVTLGAINYPLNLA